MGFNIEKLLVLLKYLLNHIGFEGRSKLRVFGGKIDQKSQLIRLNLCTRAEMVAQ